MSTADVVVVGAGAVGCAIAHALAEEGLEVQLIERDRLASQASGAAAGMLAPIAEATEVSPFLLFGVASLGIYPDLCADLRDRSGVDPEYIQSGILRVARSDGEAASLRSKMELVAREPLVSPLGGDDWRPELEWLDIESVHEFEPNLCPDAIGGLWSPDEAQVRSPMLARAYAEVARSLGCTIEEGVEVVGLICSGGKVCGVQTSRGEVRCGAVVLCAGSWSGEWLEGIECDDPRSQPSLPKLPVIPERGQILSLKNLDSPLTRILWSGETYLVPKNDGRVVVGATQEEVGYDCGVTREGLDHLLREAQGLIPEFAGAQVESSWAGLRPKTPDGLPNIGAIPGCEGLLVACGHYRNGVLLSAVTAQLIRDLIFGKTLPSEASAFDPARWSA
jgi:glycine oxidase